MIVFVILLKYNFSHFKINTVQSNAKNSISKFLLLASIVMILVGSITEYVYIKTTFGQKPKIDSTKILSEYQKTQTQMISPNNIALSGSLNARVQMVVFSSFQCPACKSFSSILDTFKKQYGDDINIVFKNFPLSENCNPRLIGNSQPQSCKAALASIVANQKNRFWQYHDSLFHSNLDFDDSKLKSIAFQVGIDTAFWENALESKECHDLLLNDINSGNELGINATPTVFINRKKIDNILEDALRHIIEFELKN